MKTLLLHLGLAALAIVGLSSCVGFEDGGPGYRTRSYNSGYQRTYYDEPAYGYRSYRSSPEYCEPAAQQHYHTTQPRIVQHHDDDRPVSRDGHHHCDCADDHHKNMSCGCRPHHPKGGCHCGM